MKRTTILNKANKILQSLQKLQERCNKLLNDVNSSTNYIPPHIDAVLNDLQDLASFDLEDSIVNAYDYEN